jgi:sec-independent protein translocase protein TatC
MSKGDTYPDPDDMFADTRMTFGEHIEDLRTHLFRAIYGFVICMVVSLLFASYVLEFITDPVKTQLLKFYERHNAAQAKKVRKALQNNELPAVRAMRLKLRLEESQLEQWLEQRIAVPRKAPPLVVHLIPAVEAVLESLEIEHLVDRKLLQDGRWVSLEATIDNPIELGVALQEFNQIVKPPSLTTLRVEESFFVFFLIAVLTGFVLSSPWVFYQVWSFVAAGLYPHEKRLVNVYMPFSLGLFLIGVAVCQFIVMPKAIEALLWFNEWLGFPPDLRLNEWLGFALFMPLVFGLSFQTPLVMLFLEKIGLFDVDDYRGKRRIAWMLMAVFAAVITPSTDAFSMMFLWIPMSLLYELGIFLCTLSPREADEVESPTREGEMVEV